MREAAEEYTGRGVESVVMAVPVGFDEAQQNATQHAAEMLGLKVARMIHEPTAAAMAYGMDRDPCQ